MVEMTAGFTVMVNEWLLPASGFVRMRARPVALAAKQHRCTAAALAADVQQIVFGRRGLRVGLQRGKAALEIGLEVIDILEPDVEPQRRAARRPLGRRPAAVAIKGNDKAFEAAP